MKRTSFCRRQGWSNEILVCDDGSNDRTALIAEEVASRVPRIRVLHNPRNMGIRPTFERLYREASREFVFLNSTDRQWEITILLDMLPLTSDFDVVIASRKDKHCGLARRFVSWAFNIIPSILFGVTTHDAGAVKLVRREIIARFDLVSRSPFSEAERLIRAARAGYRITSYPGEVSEHRRGRARGVSPRSLLEAVSDVIRVWLVLGRGRTDR